MIRKALSLLILLICAVPMLGGGIQPLSVIPAVMCIAMREDMYFTMGAAVVGGVLIDLSCGSALGANAILLVCWGSLAVLLFEQLLRRGFLHYIWLTAAVIFLQAGLRYGLQAMLHRTAGTSLLWTEVLLPSALRTLLVALLVYLLYLPLSKLSNRRGGQCPLPL